jgi:hypothetical protein
MLTKDELHRLPVWRLKHVSQIWMYILPLRMLLSIRSAEMPDTAASVYLLPIIDGYWRRTKDANVEFLALRC